MSLSPRTLFFVNKGPSSSVLSRSSRADEKSQILSHVQNKRRKGEARAESQTPWEENVFTMTLGNDKSKTTDQAEDTDWKGPLRLVPRMRLSDRLPEVFPRNNGYDPFHCTVVADDAGTHAMLHFTFVHAAKNTFLAEAFAPTDAIKHRVSMRHEKVIRRRLCQCIDDAALLYSTLAYGASCLGWMEGSVIQDRPPEYFLDKALRAVRIKVAESNGRADDWLLLSIYALAITELWNGIPAMWRKCPKRFDSLSSSGSNTTLASRTHLAALLQLVESAGGWKDFDPYGTGKDLDVRTPRWFVCANKMLSEVLESAILADKFRSLWDMAPPVIPLTWDPGPLAVEKRQALGLGTEDRPQFGRSLLKEPLSPELRQIVEDIIDYTHIASEIWQSPEKIQPEIEAWLFFRLQALVYRLLLLENLDSRNKCVRLTALVFLCNSTAYYGAQVGAETVLRYLHAALDGARFWEETFGQDLRLWCLCTGAMTERPSPDRAWFTSMLFDLGVDDASEAVLSENLETFLFLPKEQHSHFARLLRDLSSVRL